MTRLLGEALARAGHSVTVATGEPGKEGDICGVRVSRCPGTVELLKQYRAADAVVLQGLTMRLGWPLLCRRCNGLVVHHLQAPACEGAVAKRLRAWLARHVRHAAVSRGLARELPWHAEAILPNPYEDEIFRNDKTIARTRDVIFVGRLISEKGVPVLIKALTILRHRGRLVTATIVGDGPERRGLDEMVKATKLEQCVEFAGQVTGPALAQLLNRHRLMVVPSVYQEPFGVVTLEGIACGCGVLGSDTGGLPEAIGPCGTTFPMGDSALLAGKIQQVLGSAQTMARFHACAERHLAPHRPVEVARGYLELFEPCVSLWHR